MKRFAGIAALCSAVLLGWTAIALVTPMAVSSAAENTATASIPIDAVTTLDLGNNFLKMAWLLNRYPFD